MPAAADLTSATTRVRRRLIPFLFLLYIVAYLDRINVGFAALQMNQALGFSARTYGLGSDTTHSFVAGLVGIGAVLMGGAALVLMARD